MNFEESMHNPVIKKLPAYRIWSDVTSSPVDSTISDRSNIYHVKEFSAD